MRALIFILFYFILTNSFSQDTLYSVRCPEGIITDSINFKRKHYYIYPKYSPNRLTVIPEKTVSEIHYSNGEVYLNENQKLNDLFFLSTNSLSGNIEYSNKFDLDETKVDLRIDLTQSLNNEAIEFHSISRSKNTAVYQGRFKTKFARKIHLTYFKLSFTKLDGKMTIRANDLKSSYTDSIKYRWEVMDTINHKNFRPLFDISRIYSLSRRFEDKKTYWEPIDFYLKSVIWKTSNYFNKNENKISQPQMIDSLPVFRNLVYIEGLSGYSNYYDKTEANYPEKATKNLISIGFQTGIKLHFGNNLKSKFGLNLYLVGFEMFIGDKDPAFSISAGQIGPSFTRLISKKSSIEILLSFGYSNYFRVSSGYIGPSINGKSNLKSNLDFKYRFQKFIIGLQVSNRFPLNLNSISMLIGYSFK